MIVRTNVTLGFVLLLCAGGCRNQVGLSVSIPRGVENVQIGTITVSEPGISEHRLSIGPHKMSWTFDGDMFTVDIDNKRGDNYLFIRTQHPWLETDGAVTVLTPIQRTRTINQRSKGANER